MNFWDQEENIASHESHFKDSKNSSVKRFVFFIPQSPFNDLCILERGC